MIQVLLGSTLSALATGIGALPILFFRSMSHQARDIVLAFTAGVMTAACFFSLIPQALEQSNYFVLCAGVLLGTIVLTLMERYIPHIDLEHGGLRVKMDAQSRLILAALILHNIPEGLSVGVSYATADQQLGPLIAFAIGLQNAPEGLLVAVFLVQQQMGKVKALLLATLSGSVEIVSGLFGFFLSTYVAGLVPYGLSFAAGAMLYIIFKELIPESHGDGHANTSTIAVILGVLVMLGLIQSFG